MTNEMALPAVAAPADQARRIGLFVLAAHDAMDRTREGQAAGQARRCWAAAVEAVWWIGAVDDQLRTLYGGRKVWEQHRTGVPAGQTMAGLIWLRHRHAHDAADSGHGRARSWFPLLPLELGSPYAWRRSTDLEPEKDGRADLRPFYEAHVQLQPLGDPVEVVLRWLDQLMPALGVDLARLRDGGDPRDLP
ncbi:hypothetical protein GB931_09445 [Modestobacter sp. I12A-02628]|uniref:Uncharacterized protein n=1 Tax=Goekera deserti TaxID=2497753 RepID=A0A7K3WJL0_9ACTN|nr:hypothetical protein [Goekera deserti]MPQ98141.1 hypothetical protein [Goekera deserti]NDI48789.1 hypothetical protein [Goekera deserti]NEL56688.1 hypothetical protein [Goekera deserti]